MRCLFRRACPRDLLVSSLPHSRHLLLAHLLRLMEARAHGACLSHPTLKKHDPLGDDPETSLYYPRQKGKKERKK